MAQRLIGVAFATAILAALAAPAGGQELDATIAELADQICSLEPIPPDDRRLLATTRERRVHLYLRCELKGRDEFLRAACCEHLTTADSQALGLCPSNPAAQARLQALKHDRHC